MRRAIVVIFSLFFSCLSSSFGCDCGRPGPACAYVTRAKVIFIGKVAFTDDDGSGTFLQKTSVRFHVEEAFKGLPPDAHDVWIDPGSFSSCYATYHVGERLLVFGYGGGLMPPDTTTMSVGSDAHAKPKPLPPGIDPHNPPMVYAAPECSGTRLIVPETEKLVAPDIEYLRRLREGRPTPSVAGQVLEDEMFGISDPQGLARVQVILAGDQRERETQTDLEGHYSFAEVPPGSYVIRPSLAAYKPTLESATVEVSAKWCGYADFDMIGSGSIEGQVLDHNGRPAPNLQLNIVRLRADGKPIVYGFKRTKSDAKGVFRFERLPRGAFEVGVNLSDAPDLKAPYRPTKWAEDGQGSIHLDPGERKHLLPFKLPVPAARQRVTVTVHRADGGPAAGADVFANVNDGVGAMGKTDTSGVVHLDLLEGIAYSLEAIWWEPNRSTEGEGLKAQYPRRRRSVAKSKAQPLAIGQTRIDLVVAFPERQNTQP